MILSCANRFSQEIIQLGTRAFENRLLQLNLRFLAAFATSFMLLILLLHM